MVSMMWGSVGRRLAFIAAAAMTAGTCLAQSAGEAAEKNLFEKGGWTMYALLLASIFAVAFILYLAFALRMEQVVPRLFRKDLLARILDGDAEGVREICNYKPNPLGEVTLAALDFMEGNPGLDVGLLKDTMQGEGERQALFISGPTQYLLDVAVIAPMMGLFGTVLGMLKAFEVVALDLAKAKPLELAGGVSEALITTAFGLLIGIPAMVFYAYFRSRSARLVAALEAGSSEVLAALIRKRKA